MTTTQIKSALSRLNCAIFDLKSAGQIKGSLQLAGNLDAACAVACAALAEPVSHEVTYGPFGGPLLCTPGLYFCTVVRTSGVSDRFGVHMKHGSPGGAFWRSENPIREFRTRAEANKFIDQLAGRVDAHKAFSDEYFVR